MGLFLFSKSFRTILWFLLTVMLGASSNQAIAVDLSGDFQNLKDHQYFLRIQIVKSRSTLRVVPQGRFILHDQEGTILYRGAPNTPIRFIKKNASSQATVYYYDLGTFPDEEKAAAQQLVDKVNKTLSLEAKLLRDPQQDWTPMPDGQLPPPLPWVVAIGPYASRSALLSDAGKIANRFPYTYFMALKAPSKTQIVAQNPAGETLAIARGYIGVRPEDPGNLSRGGAIDAGDQGWMQKSEWEKNRAYRGNMEVWGNKVGYLSLINRVFIEDYLNGVVPAEIGYSAPFETMKVQAVISRSVAIAKLRRKLYTTWHCDLTDDHLSQVYRGALVGTPESQAAIDATWGQVCVHGNHVIEAVYTLCCGGVTADSEDAWGNRVGYLRGRVDALEQPESPPDFSQYQECERWINSNPDVLCNPKNAGLPPHADTVFRWSRTYSAQWLTNRLKELHYVNVDWVTNVSIAERTPSGLITQVRIDTTPRGAIVLEGESRIRRTLGGLPSPFFTLDRTYGKNRAFLKVQIKGAGIGHNVGLCQMGAMAMAEKGYSYIEILKHYFTDIEVYQIYQ